MKGSKVEEEGEGNWTGAPPNANSWIRSCSASLIQHLICQFLHASPDPSTILFDIWLLSCITLNWQIINVIKAEFKAKIILALNEHLIKSHILHESDNLCRINMMFEDLILALDNGCLYKMFTLSMRHSHLRICNCIRKRSQ